MAWEILLPGLKVGGHTAPATDNYNVSYVELESNPMTPLI